MSSTVLPDGSVRLAPDRGHRDTAPAPLGATLGALTGAVIMGGVALRSLGLQVGLPLIGVTAVVTLAAVVLWRWSSPRLLSVTVSPDAVVYRRYGRVRTLRRDEHLRSVVRVVPTTGVYEVDRRFLVLWGTGDPVLVNLAHWSPDDAGAIAAAVPAGRRDDEPRRASAADLAREAPGAVPFTMRHPYLTGLGLAAACVAAAVLVLWAVATSSTDEAGDPAGRYPASAPVAQDLSPAAARRQDAVHVGAQDLLRDERTRWRHSPPEAADCGPDGGWQRVLVATSPHAARLTDVRAELDALAASHDLVPAGETPGRRTYASPESQASLDVSVSRGRTVVRSASSCVRPE